MKNLEFGINGRGGFCKHAEAIAQNSGVKPARTEVGMNCRGGFFGKI
ncbi:hypothetical protein [Chroococcidiopsis cubana]|nr:hypothetical protein [Chroococcidiopsis cubana]